MIPYSMYEAPPQSWDFNRQDFEKYKKKHWRCPVRLLKGGVLARLWKNGNSAVISVLPVLAVHTWPVGEGEAVHDSASWTPPFTLSVRRIARLAGVSVETARKAIRLLEELEFLRHTTVAPPEFAGGPPRFTYELSANLYAHGEPHVIVPAALVYGGAWAALGGAARYLLLVIALAAPVHDIVAYKKAIVQRESVTGVPLSADDAAERVALELAKKPLSLSKLVKLSGLARSTVQAALGVLTGPIKGARSDFVFVPAEVAAHGSRYFIVDWSAVRERPVVEFPDETAESAGAVDDQVEDNTVLTV